MNMLFDSHCHLNDPAMYGQIDQYIQNSRQAGVNYMCVIGYDLKSSLLAVQIARKYPNIYATVGIIPNELDNMQPDDINKIEKLLADPKVVAVGEIGLDYYHYAKVERNKQKQYFELFIKMAYKHQKPITIHSRDAAQDTYDILKSNQQYLSKGIMHCYSYSLEMANKFIDLGFYISLAGPLTYKNSKEQKRVATHVPLARLLVETDSPYLTPEPKRGQKNEPANVTFVCACIASLKGMSFEEVAQQTLKNTQTVYGIQDE